LLRRPAVDIVHAIKDKPHNLVRVTAAGMAGVSCIAPAHGVFTEQSLIAGQQ
jgi:hypothetical protein